MPSLDVSVNMSKRNKNRIAISRLGESFIGKPKVTSNKLIVVIESPPFAPEFVQVTCLMSPEELEGAKKERPDLIFKTSNELIDLPPEATKQQPTDGLSVKGMVLPANVDIEWVE